MSTDLYPEMLRIGSAASDLGALAWARVFVTSGAVAFLSAVLGGFHRRRGAATVLALLVVLVGGARHAQAQTVSDEEVGERLQFIEARLRSEATGARAWEAGWSLVYVGGLGFGSYQIAQSGSAADLTQGIVGVTKSAIGAAGLALNPLKTARGVSELDGVPGATLDERLQRLGLAESLLRRNAKESDIRYTWKPHVLSLLLNIAGGIAIWIAGDLPAAAQSTAIAIAVGQLNTWTRPWKAKKDLREYQRQFGGMAGVTPARETKTAAAPSLRFAVSGLQLTF